MYEMKSAEGNPEQKLQSVSIFVGTGRCNANCSHCAGKIHRRYAPAQDGYLDEMLVSKTLEECYQKGARYLSISSSGEPTLSPIAVTKALEIVHDFANKGMTYSHVNLYSNGIIIGEDKNFCDKYLSLWKKLGLTTIYVTVHSIEERKNAQLYGVEKYPSLEVIVHRIHEAGLRTRANIILSKSNIHSLQGFSSMTNYLKSIGIDSVSAWPIRNEEDNIDTVHSPEEQELDKIASWIKEQDNATFNIKLLREDSHSLYKENKKLTLFPDGTLSNAWCK